MIPNEYFTQIYVLNGVMKQLEEARFKAYCDKRQSNKTSDSPELDSGLGSV